MRRNNDHTNICIDCKNACGGCSWSASTSEGKLLFEPVPGWTAERVVLNLGKEVSGPRLCDTYHITACPQFVPDLPCTHRPTKHSDLAEERGDCS